MAEAKVGQSATSYKEMEDMDYYGQPLPERHRCHSKTGNVLRTNNRFTEEMAHKS